jgi:hypothetical protein
MPVDILDVDRAIALLAEDQHGVAARAQLRALGLTEKAIAHRLRTGRLLHRYRGVYAVGHGRLSRRGRFMAAVLAAGPGAVLSHRSAAELWDMRDQSAGRIEVTAPRRRRLGPAVALHRRALPADETTSLDAIPVTTVSRTIADLAEVVPKSHCERAMARADGRRLTDRLSVADIAARHPRQRGMGTITALLAADGGPAPTRSELEARFLDVIDEAGLPRPRSGVHLQAGGRARECDAVWAHQRLVVELDGRRFHDTAVGLERDRRVVEDLRALLRIGSRRL